MTAPRRRPVIGLSAYRQQARWGAWDAPATLVPQGYLDCVVAAGGQPVVLPPTDGSADLVDLLDGLIIIGGEDVDPRRYGAERHPHTGPENEARDSSDLALIDAALRAGLPLLGICRGLQLLNIHLGGTLVQHLPDRLAGDTVHSPAPGAFTRHPVSLVPESRLARLYTRTELDIATQHHQAVDVLGQGLVVSAHAPDGTVEAVELPGAPFVVAVQWHPEADGAAGDLALFGGLMEAAGR